LKKHEQSEHELSETLSPGAAGHANGNGHQQVLFTPLDRAVLDKLRDADLDQLKPLDALNLLAELKKQIL
jgi:DNA mismatch repair protein MutS